jgi:hypothetical protein
MGYRMLCLAGVFLGLSSGVAKAQENPSPETWDEEEEEIADEDEIPGLRAGVSLAVGIPHSKLAFETQVGKMAVQMAWGQWKRTWGPHRMSTTLLEFSARVFPFESPFYSSFAFGQQNLAGERKVDGQNLQERLRSRFFTTQFGYQWQWGNHWYLAQEIGVVHFLSTDTERPLTGASAASSSRASQSLSTKEKETEQIRAKARTELADILARHGKFFMPQFTILKVGCLF